MTDIMRPVLTYVLIGLFAGATCAGQQSDGSQLGYVAVEPDADPPLAPHLEIRSWLLKLKAARLGLNEDRARAVALTQGETSIGEPDALKLRLQLERLLTSLSLPKGPALRQRETRDSPPDAPPLHLAPLPSVPDVEPPVPLAEPKAADVHASKVVEPLALAQALFRIENYQGALQAYRLLPLEGLKAEERAPIQYMIATCLRKLGKTEEAVLLYREVGNSRGDANLAACAQWQIAALRWRQEMGDQLTQLRQRRLALEKQP